MDWDINIPLCTQMAKSNYGEMKQEYVCAEVDREVHLERKREKRNQEKEDP